jgi:hypothetical protein
MFFGEYLTRIDQGWLLTLANVNAGGQSNITRKCGVEGMTSMYFFP